MLDKMKTFMEMQKKMQEMKRQLEASLFEVQSSNGIISIQMSGAQEVKDVQVKADFKALDARALEAAIQDALTKAIKQSQVVAAEKMKSIAGFNLPGMASK